MSEQQPNNNLNNPSSPLPGQPAKSSPEEMAGFVDLSACPLPQQQQNVIELCEELLNDAEDGRIVSLAYVTETIDGAYEHGYTAASQDVFGRFGYLMFTALRTMGFQTDQFEAFPPPSSEEGDQE